MVSRQLVYVTGMLEVILGLSDPSGGSKRVAELSEASEGVRDAGQVWPGTRKTSQAAAAAPRPRKVSKRAAERFRGLGKHQNTPLNVSEGSESIKTRR